MYDFLELFIEKVLIYEYVCAILYITTNIWKGTIIHEKHKISDSDRICYASCSTCIVRQVCLVYIYE